MSSPREVTEGGGLHLETGEDMLEHELYVALQIMPCG